MKNAEILGADSSIKVNFLPTPKGSIVTNIANLTGREQKGLVKVAGKTVAFDLGGNKNEQKTIVPNGGNSLGKMYTFKQNYTVKLKDCSVP